MIHVHCRAATHIFGAMVTEKERSSGNVRCQCVVVDAVCVCFSCATRCLMRTLVSLATFRKIDEVL